MKYFSGLVIWEINNLKEKLIALQLLLCFKVNLPDWETQLLRALTLALTHTHTHTHTK